MMVWNFVTQHPITHELTWPLDSESPTFATFTNSWQVLPPWLLPVKIARKERKCKDQALPVLKYLIGPFMLSDWSLRKDVYLFRRTSEERRSSWTCLSSEGDIQPRDITIGYEEWLTWASTSVKLWNIVPLEVTHHRQKYPSNNPINFLQRWVKQARSWSLCLHWPCLKL